MAGISMRTVVAKFTEELMEKVGACRKGGRQLQVHRGAYGKGGRHLQGLGRAAAFSRALPRGIVCRGEREDRVAAAMTHAPADSSASGTA